jgi:hypothetical protein
VRALCLALLFAPVLAYARPSVAVAPLDGDDSGKVTAIVVEEAGAHAKVTGPKPTQREADALNITDYDKKKSLKKLRAKLGVDAVIHGSVEKDGSKHKLTLSVLGRGPKMRKIEIKYKSEKSKEFRKELRAALQEKVSDVDADEQETPDEEEGGGSGAGESKHDHDRDSGETKHDRDRDSGETKHDRERDSGETKHDRDRAEDKHERKKDREAEEEEPRHRRHHREPRHQVTQAALWVDGGAAGLHRTLTYGTANPAMPPPPVGTGSFSPWIDAELYPWSFAPADPAGFGFAASLGKTVGLSIQVPGTTTKAPIDEGHESIGLRYRFVTGESSLAVGLDLWRTHFIADRSNPTAATLDMPDTDYTAVAPGVVAKFAVSPSAAIVAGAEVPLVLAAGPITSAKDFGSASVIAVALQAGVDLAFADHYGLRIAGVLEQLSLSFQKGPRGVTDATDRTMGVVASFAVLY